MAQIIKLSLDAETEGKKLEFLVKKKLAKSNQEFLKFLINEKYESEMADELRYSKKGNRGSRQEQDEKIAELEKMSLEDLTKEVVDLGWIDKYWIDLEIKGVTMYPEWKEVKGQKVFGTRYEYSGNNEPTWQPTMTFDEVVKDLIKKKLI